MREDDDPGSHWSGDHRRFTPEQAQITIIDPKTTLIGKIRGPHVRAYAYTADDIDAAIGELVAELQDRLPPSGLTQEELLNLKSWEGPHHFVLIDDEHELRPHNQIIKPAATAPLWRLIERSREIGLHVIASRLPGNWAAQVVMNPFLQKMNGVPFADLVHGQRPGERQGFRQDQCPATAARAWTAGHNRGRHRGRTGG